MERNITLAGRSFSHTDLVRFWVIASLTFCCVLIAALSLSGHIETIYGQLFYFPILYATYFYPKKGIWFSGACAIFYEVLAYVYVFPDTAGLIITTGQAILFVCIAGAVAYFTEKVNASESRYRSIFETSLLGIVLFDQNRFGIRLANTQIERMLGYTAEDLASMSFSQLFFTKDGQRKFFENLGSSEDITDFETSFVTRNNEPFWVNLSWSRIDGNLVSCSVIDINQRKLAERAAEENYLEYKQVTENSPTGIVIVNDNKIGYVNPAFTVFSGYAPEELLDSDIRSLIVPEEKETFPDLSANAGAGDIPRMGDYRFLPKTGNPRQGALIFTRIVQRGEPAVLINLLDVTERGQFTEPVHARDPRSREAVAAVAHDLRTPLQPIMGYLNLLTGNPQTYGVNDETRIILDRCAKSVDRERQIINRMMELATLDSGKITVDYSNFSLPVMLKSIIDAGGYRAKADITIDVPEDLAIDGDEKKLATVFDSMISNAVNYSKPPRKIRVVYKSVQSDSYHRIAIHDNGVGITEAQLDEIFEPVKLPENDAQAVSRKYERIGLSLSIAKKYVQMHGGYISVDSIVNLGSTFTVHIPKRRPAERS